MVTALWMPVEMPWSTLNCGDYSSLCKTKTVLQGMKPACKKDQENFTSERGECTLLTCSPVALIP